MPEMLPGVQQCEAQQCELKVQKLKMSFIFKAKGETETLHVTCFVLFLSRTGLLMQ